MFLPYSFTQRSQTLLENVFVAVSVDIVVGHYK